MHSQDSQGGEAISRKTWAHNPERYLARGTRWITALPPRQIKPKKEITAILLQYSGWGGEYWQVNSMEKDTVIVDSLI